MEAVKGFVYVAVDPPECKIGHTINPINRGKFLYNGRGQKPPIRRIWPVGEKARAVEQAVIKRLARRRSRDWSAEWFEIGVEEIYKAVDACVLQVVGKPIPGVKFSEASFRRHYL